MGCTTSSTLQGASTKDGSSRWARQSSRGGRRSCRSIIGSKVGLGRFCVVRLALSSALQYLLHSLINLPTCSGVPPLAMNTTSSTLQCVRAKVAGKQQGRRTGAWERGVAGVKRSKGLGDGENDQVRRLRTMTQLVAQTEASHLPEALHLPSTSAPLPTSPSPNSRSIQKHCMSQSYPPLPCRIARYTITLLHSRVNPTPSSLVVRHLPLRFPHDPGGMLSRHFKI